MCQMRNGTRCTYVFECVWKHPGLRHSTCNNLNAKGATDPSELRRKVRTRAALCRRTFESVAIEGCSRAICLKNQKIERLGRDQWALPENDVLKQFTFTTLEAFAEPFGLHINIAEWY